MIIIGSRCRISINPTNSPAANSKPNKKQTTEIIEALWDNHRTARIAILSRDSLICSRVVRIGVRAAPTPAATNNSCPEKVSEDTNKIIDG